MYDFDEGDLYYLRFNSLRRLYRMVKWFADLGYKGINLNFGFVDYVSCDVVD